MAIQQWRNIRLDSLSLHNVTPMSGDTVDELMEYWEEKQMQVFYAEEYYVEYEYYELE